ncbi:MAG: hypothetical protein PHW73_05975 [Atribacterota bacterium]|nr:hypothetical protein [Atribacterota bacterium]
MIYTNLTLGELLSSDNPAIKRNAVGILKQLQKHYVYATGGLPSTKQYFIRPEKKYPNGKILDKIEIKTA